MNFEKYLYSVGWSDDDKAFVARVAEFPSLAAHGDSQAEALAEIKSVVKFVVKDLRKNKETIPEPIGKRSYSGKFVVRMPEYLHRKLAIEASQQNISLNQLLNLKLETSN
jgi:predicted HicB family RNase H-like nuclease